MLKITPDPPDTDNLSARINATPRKPSRTFMIAPGLDTETLLAHACESLASASIMASGKVGSKIVFGRSPTGWYRRIPCPVSHPRSTCAYVCNLRRAWLSQTVRSLAWGINLRWL